VCINYVGVIRTHMHAVHTIRPGAQERARTHTHTHTHTHTNTHTHINTQTHTHSGGSREGQVVLEGG
jgi:hypothetical protein